MRIDDHFQRLLISLGYAAQHMPCLKSLKFGAVSRESFNLEFQNAEETILHLECYDDFWPDIRVAKAWKFDMCDLTIDKWGPFGWEVKFPVWPPQESG